MKTSKARSIHLPERINTFPQVESTDMVSVPASFLNQILEEVQALREAVARLEAKQKQETQVGGQRSESQALKEAAAELQNIAELKAIQANQKQEIQSSDANQNEEDKKPPKKPSLPEPKQDDTAKTIFLDTKKRDDLREIKVLKDELIRLETGLDKDMERISLDIALDRQRLAKLEQKRPQPLQKDRGRILSALIASSGGKILAKQARQIMHLDKATFSRLLTAISDLIIKKVYSLDRRQRVLLLG